MLRYEVKLDSRNYGKEKLVWSEGYISPDLTYMTGVTETKYHLEKYPSMVGSNSIINGDGGLYVESKNVTRQGYIIVKEKAYKAYNDTIVSYLNNSLSGTLKQYTYIENKGKYFYLKEDGKYHFNNLLNVNYLGEITEECEVPATSSDTIVRIDTLYWIENGKVEIDGETYIYDKEEGSGILKYYEEGAALRPTEITDCTDIEFYPYESISEYKTVSKFKFTKKDEIEWDFDRITYITYLFFVKYKNHYCPIKISGDTNGDYTFVCEVPKYVLDGGEMSDNDGLENKFLDVYFNYSIDFETSFNEGWIINSENYKTHRVKNLDDLLEIDAFVKIDDNYYHIDYQVMNANGGSKIGIYLEAEHAPLALNDLVVFTNGTTTESKVIVYNSTDYGSEADEKYVVYDGMKYIVKPNLCDKVLIEGEEYDIKYVDSTESGNCLVTINGEDVPMKITVNINDGVRKLTRYGLIVVNDGTSNVTSSATYDIVSYSGVTLNGKNCIVKNVEYGGDDNKVRFSYATLVVPNRYTFRIESIMGSSLYICSPFLDNSTLSRDFIRTMSEEICQRIVTSQSLYSLLIKNKIFGEFNVTKELPFRNTETPTSTDDFYDLSKDLNIFVNTSFITIPFMFETSIMNNLLQDDIVGKDFFEAEKKKAINPIVDMEKDIYLPKYIQSTEGLYTGSNTIFKPIYKINFNFHFRTRNLDSWKVNEGGDNEELKDRDMVNWFVTDYEPYKSNLSTSGDTFQSMSDLMGLLYFTNNDIYYQKSRVAKSFARLSFYDSIDPQSQSLLATSTVFVDEHKLFKRYIDNSRKNVNKYVMVNEKSSGVAPISKVSVMTEFGGVMKSNNTSPYELTIDENHRISSRLTVDNKYVTDTSSEGYYLYMFREYAEKLHPKPIYMKIDFNHAGIGKTIPFIIPMHWNGNTSMKAKSDYNRMYPDYALQLSSNSDLKELKDGVPLSYVYAQTYIPLYAVYDFVSKEYGYVFDNRYVEIDEDGVLNLNLFEMKIKDESEETVSEEELDDIKNNRQKVAVININPKQFNRKYFIQDLE